MNRKMYRVFNVLIAVAFVFSLAGAPVAKAASGGASYMPPNPDKIAEMLRNNGTIPADATPDQVEAAVTSYLQLKLKYGMDRGANPRAHAQVEMNESLLDGNAIVRGRKLGNEPLPTANAEPQFKEVAGSDKLLLILIEFSNTPYTWTPLGGEPRTTAGPLHNEIPVPTNNFDLWVPDFSTQHFEDMLFTPGGWTIPDGTPYYGGLHRGSMHDYYLEQSYGKYTVDGTAYGWFTVDKPEAYYGDDRPTGGNDNYLPGTTSDLIADAVDVINAQDAIDWEEYDTNGDCVIDHPLFIHAGIDQSGGGGAQGDDAIWAHSSSVDQLVATTAACPDGLYISNYTIMPEDGGVGVFAHEFGHDLGLPDEYDTIYSGRGDSVGFWSLMSSGSWIGQPAQTQPSDISIWGRMALGWLKEGENLITTSIASLTKDTSIIRLEQGERWSGPGTKNAIRINLPQKYFYVNTPYSGAWEWFGGKADQVDTTLMRAVDLTGKTSASLSFWTWYDIEEGWDFGFVQVSTDNGATWTSLPIAGTTSVIDPSGYPTIVPNLPGFTGNSNGWVNKTYDLKDYVGKSILLQFRYMTDWATSLAGFYVDDIGVTADGAPLFFDNVETLDPAWTASGWVRDQGSSFKNQYYLLEWRNLNPMETPWGATTIVNFDNGLKNAYSFDALPGSIAYDSPAYFSYAPGMLLWYRDMSYTDNWTGVHPGHGFLLVVDAHSAPMLRPPLPKNGSLPWSSRIQTYDATFSLNSAPNALLTYWGITRLYRGANAVPNFDDSQTYWSSKAPAASVITPKFGLLFRVLGQAEDGSAALVGLSLK